MKRPLPRLALAVAVMSVVFALSPLLTSDFAGYRPEQFPIKVDVWPVQPAGWAFGIWGLIYLWLIAGAVWGLLNAPTHPEWQAMRAPLLISLGIGAFWIKAASASPLMATGMIFVMAGFAIVAMLRANGDDPIWQRRPVALYAGWLTAATGVGTGVVLGGYDIVSPQTAAFCMISAVLVIALYVQSLRPAEWGYSLAVLWALSGVVAANVQTANWPVVGLSALGALALLIGFFLRSRGTFSRVKT